MNPTLVHGHSFVNLTPHPVSWKTPDGEVHTVPPVTPGVTQLSVETITVPAKHSTIGGIPFQEKTFGDVKGLPSWLEWECRPNTVFIVSGLVLNAIKEKRAEDGSQNPQPREIWLSFVAPATGPSDGASRNAAGQVEFVTKWDVAGIA